MAAVNGACLGGGVEIALHCDARTISTAVRHFACPECFLGIVPAWGGTQLVPRLVGAETAVKFVVANPMRQNRMLTGRGGASSSASPTGCSSRPSSWTSRSPSPSSSARPTGDSHSDSHGATEVLRKARGRLDDQVHGAAPAPYKALDLIEGALSGWSLEEGYAAEEEAVGELLPGPAGAGLALRLRPGRPPGQGARRPARAPSRAPIRKVGLVGAGLMAAQLATLFLRRLEVPVAMRDLSEEALAQRPRDDRGGARRAGRQGPLRRGQGALPRLARLHLDGLRRLRRLRPRARGGLRGARGQAAGLRRAARARRARLRARDEHFEPLGDRDGRRRGIHFFNPVAVLPLVELVRTPDTDDETLATAWAFAEGLRKRPVLVADAPAFVVNRVLTRLMSVVLDALERGTDPDEADEAILALGLPMAPSVLLQMVGPRVANHVLGTLHDAYPDRFPLSPTLANYAEGRDEIVVREHAPLSRDEMLEAALEALADEIHHLLEEGVVAEAKDVDTALLLGAGWPFWLGGITKYLDQAGISEKMFGRPLAEAGAGAPAA